MLSRGAMSTESVAIGPQFGAVLVGCRFVRKVLVVRKVQGHFLLTCILHTVMPRRTYIT